jgi:ankyrin repeat protein
MSGALHGACSAGNLEEVRRLCAAGADPLAPDDSGICPLHLACGHADVLRFLLTEHGAGARAADALGRTPLHYATKQGAADCILQLLRAGADVGARDKYGRSPLHLATTVEAALPLLEAGANANDADNRGRTPLHGACNRDDVDLARLLLSSGADPSAADTVHEYAPLHLSKSDRMTEMLLHAGADVHAMCASAETPLHCACTSDRAGSVRMLLAAGASALAENCHGEDALEIAMCPSTKGWDESVVHALLDSLSPGSLDEKHGCLLCAAIGSRKFDIARKLIYLGAPLLRLDSFYRCTPLHLACKYDTTGDFVREFATAEAIRACDGIRRAGAIPISLLEYAIVHQNTEAINVLTQRGAKEGKKHRPGPRPVQNGQAP